MSIVNIRPAVCRLHYLRNTRSQNVTVNSRKADIFAEQNTNDYLTLGRFLLTVLSLDPDSGCKHRRVLPISSLISQCS